MCIIAAKCRGVEFPDMDTIENMWYSNRDGAGLMWAYGNKVYISKGYMTLASLKTKIEYLKERYDLKDLGMVLHFRISTHGGTIPENTHPFPIVSSIGALKKLEFKTNIGVAHNGIIPITPRDKNISDTMEYIVSQLHPIKCIKSTFYSDKNCQKLIYNAIDSKMAFLNFDGKIHFIGDFITEKDGMIYSNSSYKQMTYYTKYPYSYYGNSLYGDSYDEYDNWHYDYSTKSYKYEPQALPPAVKQTSTPITTVKPLMWVDYDLGYIVDAKGEMNDWEICLFDSKLNVYKYNVDDDQIYLAKNYRLESHRTSNPIVFDENLAEMMEVNI